METNHMLNAYKGKLEKGSNIIPITLLVFVIASMFWGCSEKGATTSEQVSLEKVESSEKILTEFKIAFESGEYEQVKALFTEDGVLTTASNVHYAIIKDDTSQLSERVDEKEFKRLATLHGGENFNILGEPLSVGDNTLAFAWEWSTSRINGTALLHLRDGKIVICILNPAQYHIPFIDG